MHFSLIFIPLIIINIVHGSFWFNIVYWLVNLTSHISRQLIQKLICSFSRAIISEVDFHTVILCIHDWGLEDIRMLRDEWGFQIVMNLAICLYWLLEVVLMIADTVVKSLVIKAFSILGMFSGVPCLFWLFLNGLEDGAELLRGGYVFCLDQTVHFRCWMWVFRTDWILRLYKGLFNLCLLYLILVILLLIFTGKIQSGMFLVWVVLLLLFMLNV